MLRNLEIGKQEVGKNQRNFWNKEFIFPNTFILGTISVSKLAMLKLTPTLLGHPTMKLGRFLQVPSTRGLG